MAASLNLLARLEVMSKTNQIVLLEFKRIFFNFLNIFIVLKKRELLIADTEEAFFKKNLILLLNWSDVFVS